MRNPIEDNDSTSSNEWDEWWNLTHKNTKASWDVAEPNDSDELDYQIEFDED